MKTQAVSTIKPVSSPSLSKEIMDLFRSKMMLEGIDSRVIDAFMYYYRQLIVGGETFLREADILPLVPESVVQYHDLDSFKTLGRAAMNKTARIVLNGGLGTTMGLTRAKSLIEVKQGYSFLDIIMGASEQETACLCLMNSFSSDHDTTCYLKTGSQTCRRFGLSSE